MQEQALIFSHCIGNTHILWIVEKCLSGDTELNCHFFLPQSFLEKGDYSVMLVKTYLLCLASSATEWYQGVWICCFSSFTHTSHIFSILFISEKEATGDFFEREASNRNKCSSSCEANSNPET